MLIIKFYKQGEWVSQKGVSKYVGCPFSHVKYSQRKINSITLKIHMDIYKSVN